MWNTTYDEVLHIVEDIVYEAAFDLVCEIIGIDDFDVVDPIVEQAVDLKNEARWVVRVVDTFGYHPLRVADDIFEQTREIGGSVPCVYKEAVLQRRAAVIAAIARAIAAAAVEVER